jgi:small subunit ribosomal protein S16
MLTIRLQRVGTKNRPAFRVVLAERERAVGKKFLEILGHYDIKNKELGIKNTDRLDYWLKQNVLLSPTVRNLLIEKKFLEGEKVKAWRPKKKETVKAEGEVSPTPTGEAATVDAKPVEAQKTETAPAPEAKAEEPKASAKEPEAKQEIKEEPKSEDKAE